MKPGHSGSHKSIYSLSNIVFKTHGRIDSLWPCFTQNRPDLIWSWKLSRPGLVSTQLGRIHKPLNLRVQSFCLRGAWHTAVLTVLITGESSVAFSVYLHYKKGSMQGTICQQTQSSHLQCQGEGWAKRQLHRQPSQHPGRMFDHKNTTLPVCVLRLECLPIC